MKLSLVPPPWLELTTSDPFAKRDPGEAAGHDLHAVGAGQDERAEIDMARRHAARR